MHSEKYRSNETEPFLPPAIGHSINEYRSLSNSSSTDTITATPCYFPQRVLIAILMFLGLCTVYILRVNLSVAIIPMSSQYHWQDNTQGIILSSFFWGYIVTQWPGGFMSQKIGGKLTLGFGILGATICTIAIPFIAGNLYILIGCRVLTGLFEGATTDVVILHWGWKLVFFSFGSLGFLWFLFWMIIASDSPENSRFISEYEVFYIQKHQAVEPTAKEPMPWLRILSSPAIWAIIISSFCGMGQLGGWSFYVILMWLPTYMKDVLNFNMNKSQYYTFLPYVAIFLGQLLVGKVADWVIEKKLARVIVVRKFCQTMGTLLPGIFLGLLCMHPPIYACLILMVFIYRLLNSQVCSVGFSSFSVAGNGSNLLDLAPQYAGELYGITNTFGNTPGIVATIATGYILKKTGSWCSIFVIAAGVYFVGWFFYIIFAKAEIIIQQEKKQKALP